MPPGISRRHSGSSFDCEGYRGGIAPGPRTITVSGGRVPSNSTALPEGEREDHDADDEQHDRRREVADERSPHRAAEGEDAEQDEQQLERVRSVHVGVLLVAEGRGVSERAVLVVEAGEVEDVRAMEARAGIDAVMEPGD